MKILTSLVVLALCSCGSIGSNGSNGEHDSDSDRRPEMELGKFSISLAVKDIATSRAFYEKLGFEVFGGDAAQNWLIMQNGINTVGLFQGMFEQNIMTFNPGWDSHAGTLETFSDIREIQRTLKERGLELTTQADESTTGPASLTLADPDGNVILIDQHVK